MSGKPCSKCKEWKPFDYFFKQMDRPGGHESQCKQCRSKFIPYHKRINLHRCMARKEISDKTLWRFWRKVDKRGPDECWNWNGAHRALRYGSFWFRDEIWAAHRVAYVIFKNEIPHNAMICHHCDNGLCVNPKHLYDGDGSDNMNDMWNRNRHPPTWGEASGMSKLTEKQVKEIRHCYSLGNISQKALATKYNVTKSLVWAIIHHRIWKHVD